MSMGSISARHARTVLEHVERDPRASSCCAPPRRSTSGWRARWPAPQPGAGVAEALALGCGSVVAHLDGDREPGPDLAAATALVRSGELADLAG